MSIILVTGGAGYIGCITCELLLKEGHKIIVIDNLTEGNLNSLPKNVIFYHGNFGDKNLLAEIFSTYEVEFVFHFAALANVPDSVINPFEYYNNNLIESFSLLEVMKKFGINKIIFSSTAAVFGEPNYIPIDETHNKSPINPYGHSKLMIEQIINDFANSYGLNFVIFRYFCAAGATEFNGESRKLESHLIPIVIDTLLGKREKVYVYGNNFNTIDGTGVRDYIHVVDIARAHILGMKHFNKVAGNSFNLGTNLGFSVMEIIERAQSLTGKMIRYQVVPNRVGDPATLVAGNFKAKNILEWVPKFGIDDIILSALRWRQNPKY
jgi:UDP-glucose 4-epimerase